MVDQSRAWPVSLDRGVQRTLAEISVDPTACREADDLPVKQILDDSQIQPVFLRTNTMLNETFYPFTEPAVIPEIMYF